MKCFQHSMHGGCHSMHHVRRMVSALCRRCAVVAPLQLRMPSTVTAAEYSEKVTPVLLSWRDH